MKIEPNRPAFPGSIAMIHNDNGLTVIDSEDRDCPGLPIRLHLAAMAMQGIITGTVQTMAEIKPWEVQHTTHDAWCARSALAYADALIAEYNKKEGKPNGS